jgi:hypothetical protein
MKQSKFFVTADSNFLVNGDFTFPRIMISRCWISLYKAFDVFYAYIKIIFSFKFNENYKNI